jgi:hypothetical protein
MAINDEVLKILTKQMGPAAASFLDRQCKSHLKKDPAAIGKPDIPELAKWVGIGASLSLGDAIGAELSKQIAAMG